MNFSMKRKGIRLTIYVTIFALFVGMFGGFADALANSRTPVGGEAGIEFTGYPLRTVHYYRNWPGDTVPERIATRQFVHRTPIETSTEDFHGDLAYHIDELFPPTQGGYRFDHWRVDNNAGPRFLGYTVDRDLRVVAQWTRTFNITFNPRDGTIVDRTPMLPGTPNDWWLAVVDENSSLGDIPRPVIGAGLTAPSGDRHFLGWFCYDSRFPFDPEETVTEDRHFIAFWSPFVIFRPGRATFNLDEINITESVMVHSPNVYEGRPVMEVWVEVNLDRPDIRFYDRGFPPVDPPLGFRPPVAWQTRPASPAQPETLGRITDDIPGHRRNITQLAGRPLESTDFLADDRGALIVYATFQRHIVFIPGLFDNLYTDRYIVQPFDVDDDGNLVLPQGMSRPDPPPVRLPEPLPEGVRTRWYYIDENENLIRAHYPELSPPPNAAGARERRQIPITFDSGLGTLDYAGQLFRGDASDVLQRWIFANGSPYGTDVIRGVNARGTFHQEPLPAHLVLPTHSVRSNLTPYGWEYETRNPSNNIIRHGEDIRTRIVEWVVQTNPVTLTALWGANVTFDLSGGGSFILPPQQGNPLIVQEGYSVGSDRMPQPNPRDGYEFVGWRVGSAQGREFDPDEHISEHITVVPVWNRLAEERPPGTQPTPRPPTTPSTPTPPTTTPTTTPTRQAVYYTVTFDPRGGTIYPHPPGFQFVTSGRSGTLLGTLQPGDPVREGVYEFVHWLCSETGNPFDPNEALNRNRHFAALYDPDDAPPLAVVDGEDAGGLPAYDTGPAYDAGAAGTGADYRAAEVVQDGGALAVHGSWALVNLLLTFLSAFFAILLLVTVLINRSRKEDEYLLAIEPSKAADGQQGNVSEGIVYMEYEEQYRYKFKLRLIVSVLAVVVSVVLFILTQDMRQPVVLVDLWTIAHALITIASLLVLLLRRRDHEDEEYLHNAELIVES